MSSVVTPPRRLLLLTLLAAVLGVLGGVAAWVLLHLIGLITNLALFQQWGWTVPSFTELASRAADRDRRGAGARC